MGQDFSHARILPIDTTLTPGLKSPTRMHKEFRKFLKAREAFMRGLINRPEKAETEGVVTR